VGGGGWVGGGGRERMEGIYYVVCVYCVEPTADDARILSISYPSARTLGGWRDRKRETERDGAGENDVRFRNNQW